MEQKELNTREEQLNDFGGGGGHGGASPEKDSRDYGKCVLIASAIVIAAVIVYLLIF